MSNFKVGDIVRRIAPSLHPERFGVEGQTYTVTKRDGRLIQVSGCLGYLDPTYLELVKTTLTLEELYIAAQRAKHQESEVKKAAEKMCREAADAATQASLAWSLALQEIADTISE